ncbi:hypothetical protein IscW_ISCW013723 [Ixodes scapularis]|uniref:Uncharacterized protein n=1 Tax=Ixodes scapularis TaxID=6945 RepID=B7QJC6_IXOSC|nr:hypothetical protein IscW_ISCW013723 [Ixodes scapularis]|eukprot:XP_002415283.1 hypothetical protein IscW_ISCW013723 [Ixodes scapularis]
MEEQAVEKKAAAKECDVETTAREEKETSRSEELPVMNDEQKDNEAHMADASTLATKRPCEWDSDELKVVAELGSGKLLPSKGALKRKTLQPAAKTESEPGSSDKPAGSKKVA